MLQSMGSQRVGHDLVTEQQMSNKEFEKVGNIGGEGWTQQDVGRVENSRL